MAADDGEGHIPVEWLTRMLLETPTASETSEHLREMAHEALDELMRATTPEDRRHYEWLCVGLAILRSEYSTRRLVESMSERLDVAVAFGESLSLLDTLGAHDDVARLRLRVLGLQGAGEP